MNNNDALTLIPARVRQGVYVALVIVSLLLTAAGLFLNDSPWGTPWWVASALQAVGVLAAPFGVLAAANVKPDNAQAEAYVVQADPDGEPKVLN